MKKCLCLILGILMVVLCCPLSIAAAEATASIADGTTVSALLGQVTFTLSQPAEPGILTDENVSLTANSTPVPVAVDYTEGASEFTVRFGELPEDAACILTLPDGITVGGSQTLCFQTKAIMHQTAIGPESEKTGNNASATFVEAAGDDPAYIRMRGDFVAGGVDFSLDGSIGRVQDSFYTDFQMRIPAASTETFCNVGLQIQNGYDSSGGNPGSWKWPVRYRSWDNKMQWGLWANSKITHDANIDVWQDFRLVFTKGDDGYYRTTWLMKDADSDVYETVVENADTDITDTGIIQIAEIENLYIKMQEGNSGVGIADIAKWETRWGGIADLTPQILKIVRDGNTAELYLTRDINAETVTPDAVTINGKAPESVSYDEETRKITVTADGQVRAAGITAALVSADGMPAKEQTVTAEDSMGITSSVANDSQIPATQGRIVLSASADLDSSTVTEDSIQLTKEDGSAVKGGYGLTVLEDARSVAVDYGDLEENQAYRLTVTNDLQSADGKAASGLNIRFRTLASYHTQSISESPDNATASGSSSITYVPAGSGDPAYLRMQVNFASNASSEAYLAGNGTYTEPFYTDFCVRIPAESEEQQSNLGFQYMNSDAADVNWRWPLRANGFNGFNWRIYGSSQETFTAPVSGGWQNMRLVFTKNEAGKYRMAWLLKNAGEDRYTVIAEDVNPIADEVELSRLTNLYLKIQEGNSSKAITDVASWEVHPLGDGGLQPKVLKAQYSADQVILSVSRDLNPATVTGANVLAYGSSGRVEAEVSYDADNRQIILTGTDITNVRLRANVLSADGMPFAADAAGLSVSGASVNEGEAVTPLLGSIDLQLSGDLDTATVTADTVKLTKADGGTVRGGYTYTYAAASKTLQVAFGELESGASYKLELTDGIMGAEGEALNPYILNFTVQNPIFRQEIVSNPSNAVHEGRAEGGIAYTAGTGGSPAYLRLTTPLYGGEQGQDNPQNYLRAATTLEDSFYVDMMLRVPAGTESNFNIMLQMENGWKPNSQDPAHGWETLMRDQDGFWAIHNAEADGQKEAVAPGEWEQFRILYEKDETGAYRMHFLVKDDNGVYQTKAQSIAFSGDQVGRIQNLFLKQQTMGWTRGTAVIDVAKWEILPLSGAISLTPAILNVDYGDAETIVTFTRDMDAASFEGLVEVYNKNGGAVSCTTSYNAEARALTITGANIAEVAFRDGVRAADGMPLGAVSDEKPADLIISGLGATDGKGGAALSQIAGITQANGCVTVENNSDEAMTVTLIIALYGQDNHLKGFDYQTQEIAAGRKEYLNDAALSDIAPDEGDFIRVYIWDGEITDAVPLDKPVDLPYTG